MMLLATKFRLRPLSSSLIHFLFAGLMVVFTLVPGAFEDGRGIIGGGSVCQCLFP
ncbi:hypothetical protein JMJ77_0010794 [Colletotrichum scovillei]|uniref:Uncharacterized protein n=1 Tax=Colletotrichum scovillei TaxID=1209932 RepID=A0A9P7R288_9PEZI|nr:hypothetical protein JMJ77_0010794 [Colletotrichum scovillei]KAG7059761.1 hypothetical protein JMJ78_0015050 [Colletotrichum scovillei]KAG7067207.1 hypothetical protein JMJ76_0008650 [Colletotrichum scovillei]